MKVTSVSRTRTHKINLGDFESLALSATLVAEVSNDDDISEVSAELEASLDEALDKPVERVLRLADQRTKIEDTHLWDFYEYE